MTSESFSTFSLPPSSVGAYEEFNLPSPTPPLSASTSPGPQLQCEEVLVPPLPPQDAGISTSVGLLTGGTTPALGHQQQQQQQQRRPSSCLQPNTPHNLQCPPVALTCGSHRPTQPTFHTSCFRMPAYAQQSPLLSWVSRVQPSQSITNPFYTGQGVLPPYQPPSPYQQRQNSAIPGLGMGYPYFPRGVYGSAGAAVRQRGVTEFGLCGGDLQRNWAAGGGVQRPVVVTPRQQQIPTHRGMTMFPRQYSPPIAQQQQQVRFPQPSYPQPQLPQNFSPTEHLQRSPFQHPLQFRFPPPYHSSVPQPPTMPQQVAPSMPQQVIQSMPQQVIPSMPQQVISPQVPHQVAGSPNTPQLVGPSMLQHISPPIPQQVTRSPVPQPFTLSMPQSAIPRQVTPPMPQRITTPIPKRFAPPITQRVTPPITQRVTPPIPQRVTPPITQRVTPPIPQRVTPPITQEVTPQQVTPPTLQQVSTPIPQRVTPPITQEVTPPTLQQVSTPIPQRLSQEPQNQGISSCVSRELKSKEAELPVSSVGQQTPQPGMIQQSVSRLEGNKVQQQPCVQLPSRPFPIVSFPVASLLSTPAASSSSDSTQNVSVAAPIATTAQSTLSCSSPAVTEVTPSCASPCVQSASRPAAVKRKPRRTQKKSGVRRKPQQKPMARRATVAEVTAADQSMDETSVPETAGDVQISDQVVEVETSEPSASCAAGSEIYMEFAKSFKACRVNLGYSYEAVAQQVKIRYSLELPVKDIKSLEDLSLPIAKCGYVVEVLHKWIADTAMAAGASAEDYNKTTKLQFSNTTTSIYPQRVRKYLETEFGKKRSPTVAEIRKMAQFLGVEKNYVREWFVNRRKEEKCVGKRPAGRRELSKQIPIPNPVTQTGKAIPSPKYDITVEVPSIHPRDIGTLFHANYTIEH